MAKTVTRDLTVGSPMKLVAGFMLPLWGGMLFQQLYNMVDTMIVGKYLGVNALAGVGSTGAICFMVMGFCIGICSGFVIPIAQKFGEGNYPELRRFMVNGAYLAAFFALVMTVLTTFLCGDILHWMKAPADTYQYAYDYVYVIFLGIPVCILYNYLSGIIRSLGDSRTPIYFLIFSSILNILLDIVSVTILGMGVEGPAWATVISQGISGLLCLAIMPRRYPLLRLETGEAKPDLPRMGRIFSVGVPMGLQYSITAIGSVCIQTATNSLGTLYIAASAAGGKVGQLFCCFFDAAGTTMSTYGGQNYGAAKLDRLRPGVRAALVLAAVYSAASFLILFALGDQMALLFMDSATTPAELRTEVAALARQYLLFNSATYIFLSLVNIIRFMIQGLGFTQQAIFAGIFEMIARCFVAFILVDLLGYTAICLANPLAWMAADVFLIPAYFHDLKKLRRHLETAAP